ncbi:MAG: hypothetical protein M8353_09825 [ANME-2 cluster archaeon]|nr:hypothetical protein [ANME-2 cluster archaeon]
MKKDRTIRLFFLVILTGTLLFMVVQFAIENTEPDQKEIPDGWKIIRPPHDVMALAIQDDTIWAGGKDGVIGLDRESGQVVAELRTEPPMTYVRALLVDREGGLWIGHPSGLTYYDGNTFQTYSTDDGLPDIRVNALMQDHHGHIWVGTWGGAAVLENGEWRTLTEADGLADDMVNVMLEDNKGGLWFGSYVAPGGGLSYYNDGKWQLFTTQNGLPHNNINTLSEDSDGNIWVGTGLYERGGAVTLVNNGTDWTVGHVLAKKDGLAGNKVRSFLQDTDGVMWFGSEYDGVARWKAGEWQVLTEKNGLSNPEIKSLVQDDDANLWIGTRDGITRLNSTARQKL